MRRANLTTDMNDRPQVDFRVNVMAAGGRRARDRRQKNSYPVMRHSQLTHAGSRLSSSSPWSLRPAPTTLRLHPQADRSRISACGSWRKEFKDAPAPPADIADRRVSTRRLLFASRTFKSRDHPARRDREYPNSTRLRRRPVPARRVALPGPRPLLVAHYFELFLQRARLQAASRRRCSG